MYKLVLPENKQPTCVFVLHTVQPDLSSTDDAFITEGSGDGRFKQNISIDLFKQFLQDGIRTNGASYLGIV